MKTIILLLISAITFTTSQAQNSDNYISEAYSLFKIKSFNPNLDTKKCEIFAYIKVGENFKDATYYIELKPSKEEGALVFRDFIDFNNISMVVAKSHRQKESVYEFNFGTFNVSEYANMRIIIVYKDGGSSTIPLEMTNYKNPITIMN